MLPKVADVGYLSGSPNPVAASESAEPHIVVACRNCSTRFAVESSAVAALDVPRFHCSRCDTVFIMSDPVELNSPSEPAPQRAESGAAPRWVLTDPAKTIDPSGTTLGTAPPSFISPLDFSVAKATEPLAPAPLRPSAAASSANHDVARDAISMSSAISLLKQGQMSLEPLGAPSETGREPNSSVRVPVAPPSPAPKRSGLRPSAGAAAAAARDPELLGDSPEGPPGWSRKQGTLRTLGSRTVRGIAATAKISTPLIASLVMLLVVTYSARVSPQSVGAIFSALIPSALTRSVPRMPPHELSVRDINLKFVRTPSREPVAVITGKLINSSGRPVSDVTLEALGFNDRGEIVLSARAPLNSALSSEKVSDLEIETIAKFQRALGDKDPSIGANESLPFTVALISNNEGNAARPASALSKVKYFSARVFSVR